MLKKIVACKDLRWLAIWIAAVACLGVWDRIFLNKPALDAVVDGFRNTFVIALLVTGFSLLLGWAATQLLHRCESRQNRPGYLVLTFCMNLIRSIPQIVGILLAYMGITALVLNSVITSQPVVFALMSLCMSIFIFPEVSDLMRDRIAYFEGLDFYSAMRVCGIPDRRIVNFDILWKNSRLHILNKLIAVLGYAVFLQCSVDFIISVGLSTDVNEVTLPPTLGSLLATIDSKQDILAVGYSLTHPAYAPNLFFEHLQGMTVAFCIVFSLFCIHAVANGYAERNRL
jgi:ABC-type dipeptide/oligopeptide/nickel transport system permease subunit